MHVLEGKSWISVLALVMLILAFSVYVHPAHAADEYDALRGKWKEMLTGGTTYNTSDSDISDKITSITSIAQDHWNTMDQTPNDYLWSDLASSTKSEDITESYRRLKAMALAYSTTGSTLANNQSFLADIKTGLDWMYTNRYYENRQGYGNWWHWEIGSPLALNDIVVLLYDQLSVTQITNYMNAVNRFQPTITMTGANRVWESTVIAVRGVIVKDGTKIALARDGLSPVFPYVTSQDGFYTDGSFIQHGKHPYNGGYGNSLLGDIGNILFLLDGSTWTVTDPNHQNVYRWVYDSFQPFVYKGAMMDMTRGREISRPALPDHKVGHDVMASIIRISQFAPPADAEAFKRMVKYWIQADVYRSFQSDVSIDMIVQANDILNDPNVTPMDTPVMYKQFPGMDRAVQLRPDFGFGVSMSSSRILKYESINTENNRGWYTGDGMTYLYNNDLAQYSDDFWPTVNPYRLPGITVDTQTRADSSGTNYLSPYKWVGGSSIVGQYGVSGLELGAWNSNLTAKKSWFMFDDEIVALGSGIANSSQSGVGWDGTARKVETIVENRKLNGTGDNALIVNGTAKSFALDWSETMPDVNWAHLAGNAAGADIGYYFPGGATLQGLREARTGNWYTINNLRGTNDAITRNYLTLWLNHGANPTNASYSYVLLPGKTGAEVGGYASNPDIEVLENSSFAQAVKENALNIVGANFWTDTLRWIQAGGSNFLSSNKKASVMTKETANDIEVAISDPTQANSSSVAIEINRSATGLILADAGITVTQLSPTIKFTVNVNAAKGRTFHAKFSYTSQTPNQSGIIQAEDYNAQFGSTIGTANPDVDSSPYVAALENGDWLEYDNVDFDSGVSTIQIRVASNNSGGTVEFRDGSITGPLLGSVLINATGGWGAWVTKDVPVTGASGIKTVYMVFKKPDGQAVANLNWWEFTKPTRIQAEDYNAQFGSTIGTANPDVDSSPYVAALENGDWLEYDNVDFDSGVSTIQIRVASNNSGGTVEFRDGSITGPLLGSVLINATGGWGAWVTKDVPVTGASGIKTVYMVFKKTDGQAVANLNWWEY